MNSPDNPVTLKQIQSKWSKIIVGNFPGKNSRDVLVIHTECGPSMTLTMSLTCTEF